MKKILFLITLSINGGAQKWTKEQIEICSHHFECYLGTGKEGWLVDHVHVKDIFLNDLIFKRFSIQYLIRLNKFISKNNIDMIIASSANAGIYARLAKLTHKNLKVIYVSHGWSSIYNGGRLKFLFTFIEKQLSDISDSILCISKKDYDNAKDIIKIKENKLKLISNKIYPMTIQNKKDNTIIKVVTVARLTPPKRVDLLIKSVNNMNLELHIIGDGPLKNDLEVQKNDNIIFHGEVSSFNQFYDYDIFALISDSEGLPLSALEAMSSGLPLVLSNVGSCYELIYNNGVLVKNNINEIEKALNNCVDNLDKYSENSKKLFNKKFNLEQNKDTYINYYNELLS